MKMKKIKCQVCLEEEEEQEQEQEGASYQGSGMNSNTNPHYQSRSQLWLKRNGIGEGDEDVVVDDEENDALYSNDQCSSPDDIFSQFPPHIYPIGGVLVFLAAVYVGSLCHLRKVKVFDEVEILMLRIRMDGTGRVPPYQCPLNSLMPVLAFSFGPCAWLSA
jgi:hypothetical protein